MKLDWEIVKTTNFQAKASKTSTLALLKLVNLVIQQWIGINQ